MPETVNWNPLRMYYRVSITPPVEKTAGGIYLPEGDAWLCNEGVVTVVGGGRPDFPGRYLFQARVGERVLFERMDLEPGINDLEGAISDEDLVGIATDDEYGIQPCGEWLLVKGSRKEETPEGFAIPERYRNRERFGTVLAYGPGRLVKKGERQGLRLTCGEMFGLNPFDNICGYRVYWSCRATLLYQPGGEDIMLVRASDIVAVEEPNNGHRQN